MNIFRTVRLLAIGITALATAWSQPASAFNIGMAPAKIQEHLKPGEEKTIVYSVTNGSTEENLRMQVLISDWSMDERGEMTTPKVGTYPYSASEWVEISPMEFVIKPRQTQLVRATYKVPADAKPGDHLCALLFRQRVIVPPLRERSMGQLVPQGLVGSLSYIAVQPEEKKFELESMKYVPAEGKNPSMIRFSMKNLGNVHINASGNIEIIDADKHVIYSKGLPDLPSILRGMSGIRDIPINTPLAPGNYEAVMNVRVSHIGDAITGRHAFTVVAKPVAPPKEAAPSKATTPAPAAQGSPAATPVKTPTKPASVTPAKPAAGKTPNPVAPAKPAAATAKKATGAAKPASTAKPAAGH